MNLTTEQLDAIGREINSIVGESDGRYISVVSGLIERGVLLTREQAAAKTQAAVAAMRELALVVVKTRYEEELKKRQLEHDSGDHKAAVVCDKRAALCDSLERAIRALPIPDDALAAHTKPLLDALDNVKRILGPNLPTRNCEGCHIEWAEALRVVRAARHGRGNS